MQNKLANTKSYLDMHFFQNCYWFGWGKEKKKWQKYNWNKDKREKTEDGW